MRTVLLTGSTGVVGSALVPALLAQTDAQIVLLIRAESDEHLKRRFCETAEKWDVSEKDRQRLLPLRGDVVLPRLGVPDEMWNQLVRDVGHVIHSAGNVKLNLSLAEARECAVSGVGNILEFARACHASGRGVKLEYLSTVGVAGRLPVLPETRLQCERQYHNTYEQSKAEAEDLIWKAHEEGLPVTIHRPSMVVGDSVTGRIAHFQVFFYLCKFLSGEYTFGVVPQLGEAKLDLIPVDYVARAIVTVLDDPTSSGKALHYCNGGDQSLLLEHLIERSRAVGTAAGRSFPRLRRMGLRNFRTLLSLAQLVCIGRRRRSLATLPWFLDYMKESQRFEQTQTAAYLEKRGVRLPAVGEYLDRILEHSFLTAAKR